MKPDTTIPKEYTEAFKQGWNAALEGAAKTFEKMHCDGPLAEFNGKWVAKCLLESKEP